MHKCALVVTEAAFKAINTTLDRRNKGRIVRIGLRVHPDKVHMMQFLEFVERCDSTDVLLPFDGFSIVINHMHAYHFNGAIVAWRENPRERGLKFHNLNKL